MEKCKTCGHLLNEEDRFCPNCGEKVFKRTVIYGPRAENIIVVEDDKTTKNNHRSSPKISTVNVYENPLIKFLRIVYVIVFSVVAIILSITAFFSFVDNDLNFGIYSAILAIIAILNIVFFVKKQWVNYFLTYLWMIIVTIVSIMVFGNGEQIVSNNTSNNLVKDTYQISENEYKEKCNTYSYEELARYPDRYKGEYAHFYGQAVQVMEENGYYRIRVATKANEYMQNIADSLYELDSSIDKSQYEIWSDDVVYVYYSNSLDARILEGDMLDVFGTMNGLKTYKSTEGKSITIPEIQAKYIEIDFD